MGSLLILAHRAGSCASQEMESTFLPRAGTIGCLTTLGPTSGLPLHFSSEDIFTRVGNALGTFLDYEKSYITSGNK